ATTARGANRGPRRTHRARGAPTLVWPPPAGQPGSRVTYRRNNRHLLRLESRSRRASINRLKLIKRQMFGRAKFDLLRKRVWSCPGEWGLLSRRLPFGCPARLLPPAELERAAGHVSPGQ